MSEPVHSGAAGPSGLSKSTAKSASSSKPTVTISVLGRELRIRSDESPEHLQALARYVDDRLAQIAGPKKAEATDPNLLLITSLQLADEIFKLKHQQADLTTRLRASTRSLLGRLDQNAIPQALTAHPRAPSRDGQEVSPPKG